MERRGHSLVFAVDTSDDYLPSGNKRFSPVSFFLPGLKYPFLKNSSFSLKCGGLTVLVSGAQRGDSGTHMRTDVCVCRFCSITAHYKGVSIVPCAGHLFYM